MNRNDQNSRTDASTKSDVTELRAGKPGSEVMGKSTSGIEPQQGSKVDKAPQKDATGTDPRSNERSKR